MQDVAAVVVDIATIDPNSKVLLTASQIATLSTSGNGNFLADYTTGMTPGQLRTSGKTRSMLFLTIQIPLCVCRGPRLPAFGYTNAFFTSLRVYDYFAS